MIVTNDIAVKVDCDLLVVGGGPAGIAAALSGARLGARTILLEQYGSLGGMATNGLVGPFMTCFDTEGEQQIVAGIFDELVRRMIAIDGALDPASIPAGSDHASFIVEAHHNVTPFDPEAMKFAAMEMVLEAGVEPKLHTCLVDVLSERGHVNHVLYTDKAGLGLARARIFIDATGDGDLAARAGCSFEMGRKEDGGVQPATMFMRIGGVDDDTVRRWAKENMKPGDRLFSALVAKAKAEGRFPADAPREAVGMYRQPRAGEWRINTSRILGVDSTDPDSLTQAEITGIRQAAALMRFFNSDCPGLEKAYLIDTAHQVGIRESRRIVGKYTLSREDVQKGRRFEDAVARYAFFLDIHNPAGGGQEGTQRLYIEEGGYFEIPYRCLLPASGGNLLITGRCISSDHQAHGAVRIMPACFATGQAGGTAAALALKGEIDPEAVDIELLQKQLRADGCYV